MTLFFSLSGYWYVSACVQWRATMMHDNLLMLTVSSGNIMPHSTAAFCISTAVCQHFDIFIICNHGLLEKDPTFAVREQQNIVGRYGVTPPQSDMHVVLRLIAKCNHCDVKLSRSRRWSYSEARWVAHVKATTFTSVVWNPVGWGGSTGVTSSLIMRLLRAVGVA